MKINTDFYNKISNKGKYNFDWIGFEKNRNKVVEREYNAAINYFFSPEYVYQVKLNNSKTILGQFIGNGNVYKISKQYISIASIEQIQDTILHEIAHGLDMHSQGLQYNAGKIEYIDLGHTKEWRRWCVLIGANPSRTKKVEGLREKTASWKFHGAVDTCTVEYLFARRPTRYTTGNYFCRQCMAHHKFNLVKI